MGHCPTLLQQRSEASGTLLFSGAPRPPASGGTRLFGLGEPVPAARPPALGRPVAAAVRATPAPAAGAAPPSAAPVRAPTPPPVPPAPQGEDYVGRRFGGFRVTKVLGEGGMGVVLLAEHTLMHKRVAVKVLHRHLAADPALVGRFLVEARAMSAIQHENVVAIHDLDLAWGQPYLVMEHLEGQSLADHARTAGALAPPLAVELLAQVCDGLGAAHARAIVHRDLKPANVFLCPRPDGGWRVKLLDFGIAKVLQRDPARTPVTEPVTQAGLLLGTPDCMAPEQCTDGAVDARTDVYAAGVLAYLLLTGRPPFQGGYVELLIAHAHQEPVPPHVRTPGVPRALSEAVLRALAKRPEARWASAADFKAALQAALAPPTPPRSAPFVARVLAAGGRRTPALPCERAGKAGLFLASEAPAPALMSDVALMLELPGGELACAGTVVRHVTPAEARAWGGRPGFGVELRDAGAPFQEAFARLLAGRRPAPTPPPLAPPAKDDPRATRLLQDFKRRLDGDHYRVLGLPQDAAGADVPRAAREARAQLDALTGLAGVQRAERDRCIERVGLAQHILGNLARRAEYDAERRNLPGVLRCLAEGLAPAELERAHRRFLAEHRVPESRVAVHLVSARALVGAGRPESARQVLLEALQLAPLHPEALARYRALCPP